MADLKYDTFRKLKEMGREPIELPADINFSGDIKMQKKLGRHHRIEFQRTGTYYHPNLCAQRLRAAEDRLKRFQSLTMSTTEQKIWGDNESKLESDVKNAYADYTAVLTGNTDDPEIKAMHDIVFGGRKMSMLEAAQRQVSMGEAPEPSSSTTEVKTTIPTQNKNTAEKLGSAVPHASK